MYRHSSVGRGGAGGKGGEISESNATVELPAVGDVGGWEGASWRPRGRGHFLSSSSNTLDKESPIGPDMEGPLRGGVAGRGSISETIDCNRSNDSNIYAFEDAIQDDIPRYTSTPSESRLVINNEVFNREQAMVFVISFPATIGQSLPTAVTDTCNGCAEIKATIAVLKTTVGALQETVVELNKRVDKLTTQKSTTPSRRPSAPEDEIFEDRRLLRIKAAAFVTGRPLSSHMCKRLVLHIYDNDPPSSVHYDDVKAINERRECRDAPTLSKWAVFELFALQELAGRNCLGGGYDSTGLAGAHVEIKKPFDELKMDVIKSAVFNIYPQQNAALQKATWTKCVEKINTDVRYLFKERLKKHEWLKLGL